jgi:DNA repair exonuclease SbcCD nuclease subunit
MKVIHLSDFHIGHPLYLIKERQRCFKENFRSRKKGGLLSSIFDEKPDVVIISGDIFDNPSPTFEDQLLFRDFVSSLESEGITVLANTGNHEKQTGSKIQCSEFFGLSDARKLGLNVFISNHVHRSKIKSLAQEMSPCDIAILHQSMCGFLPTIMTPEIDEEAASIFASKCKYLALGDLHVHKFMKIGECIAAYPGTVDFLRVGEPTQHGFWRVQLSSQYDVESVESVEFEPFQKTKVFKLLKKSDYEKAIKEIEDDDGSFFVIGYSSSNRLGDDLKFVLEKKKENTENFCYRLFPIKEKRAKAEEKVDSKECSEFVEILESDDLMTQEEKRIATRLWNSNTPREGQQILEEELEKMLSQFSDTSCSEN